MAEISVTKADRYRGTFVPAVEKLLGTAAFILLHPAHPNPIESNPWSGRLCLLAHVLAQRFWTSSIWESKVVLTDFIHKLPRREAMISLRGYMAGTEFTRWNIKGAAVPPRWRKAMERFNADESEHRSTFSIHRSSR